MPYKDPELAAAQRKLYRNNPETRPAQLKKERTRYAKRKQFFDMLKTERGCYDCGGMFPAEALDWDHAPGAEKCFNIGDRILHPIEETMTEISKCQVVCATCHRIRTASRRKEKI